ncbi:MAG: helix-turn-helix domain-containing protein, partial [Actinomycetales bacterium]
QELLAVIWGDGWVDSTPVLQVQISRLRRKLRGDSPSWRFVTRVRNFGYRFDPEVEQIRDDQPWQLILTYDVDLILRSVTPHEPFLGWNPDDIIGTPFMLAGISHADAKGIVQVLISAGQLTTSQAIAAKSASGLVVPAELELTLITTPSGAFAGMTGRVRFVTPT